MNFEKDGPKLLADSSDQGIGLHGFINLGKVLYYQIGNLIKFKNCIRFLVCKKN